jgi:hypothetical protein
MGVEMKLKVFVMKEGKPVLLGFKEFKPVGSQASKWVRVETKGIKTIDVPQTTDGIKIADGLKPPYCSMIPGAMGFFANDSNSPYKNAQSVAIFTLGWTHGHGLSIIPENFMKVCSLFAARKVIKSNWINQKDEYSAPNTEMGGYEQFNNDAAVFSLFNSSSNQSSLRNIQYKGETHQIENQFFFMSIDEMKRLANKSDFREMVSDIKQNGGERYVYKLLEELELSDDARDVLESARDLVRTTMDQRKKFHLLFPKLHLNAWDAGYLQLKKLWQDKTVWNSKNAPGFNEFREKYLKFEVRMRQGVYEFGFLQPDNIS